MSRAWMIAAAAAASCAPGDGPAAAPAQQPAALNVPGGCSTRAPRGGDAEGCFLAAVQRLGKMAPRPVYWHIYAYAGRAEAEAAADPLSIVVEAFERTWLYALKPKGWHPRSGLRMAVLGPFPIRRGVDYTARYMQATFSPGMKTGVHAHSGPEAWYVVSGAQCLQMPDQTLVVRAGEGAVVPEGPPMVLSSVGQEMRRSVLLVLHETNRPWTMVRHDWHPEASCPAA
ncbi:MAG TPA: cupin domain-containing protein [Allosphingosinicella sp.]